MRLFRPEEPSKTGPEVTNQASSAFDQHVDVSEQSLRKKVSRQELRLREHPTDENLRSTEQSRYNLAEKLYAKGKYAEAEKLFQDCVLDHEGKSGYLPEVNAQHLLTEWAFLGLQNRKVSKVAIRAEASLDKTKSEVDRFGLEPKAWLTEAMKNNRLLAIGEEHIAGSSHRQFLSTIMSDLKAAGATHLAVEFPDKYQAMLDHFVQGYGWDFPHLPYLEELSPELFQLCSFQTIQDKQNILTAAQKAGLKIVAVDSAEDTARGLGSAIYGTKRDQYMAQRMASILEENKDNKVVFWGGARHAASAADQTWHDSACEMLRKRGYAVESVTAEVPEVGQFSTKPLHSLTKYVKKPTIVPIAKTKTMAELPAYNDPIPGQQKMNNWDAVIIYPEKRN